MTRCAGAVVTDSGVAGPGEAASERGAAGECGSAASKRYSYSSYSSWQSNETAQSSVPAPPSAGGGMVASAESSAEVEAEAAER